MGSGLALRAYYALPIALQNLAISAYGWRLRRLRYGPEHRGWLADLASSERDGPDEIRARQLRSLNELLRHARSSVPHYAEAGALPDAPLTDLSQLTELAILTKDDVRRAGSRLVASPGPPRLHEVHTGGTTGTPLTIYCDAVALQRNYAFFSRFRSWAGVAGDVRIATFAGRTLVSPDRDRAPFWRRNRAMRQMLFSSYHISAATLPSYVSALQRFAPEMIDSYPSSLRPIARHIVDRAPDAVRPAAIITSSETLDDETRALLEEAFRCRVFDHYGAAEMAAFITQCDAGGYHVNHEFGIVEILGEGGVEAGPGESGEIVATGFINPTMPLIRYATGDRATRGGGPCPCGRHMPLIERIDGRVDDVLITPSGRLVGRLDPIFKSTSGILETRIVQDRLDHVRVEIVPEEGFVEAYAASLTAELRRRLGPEVEVDVVCVSEIPRSASGKLRTVVREFPLRETGADEG